MLPEMARGKTRKDGLNGLPHLASGVNWCVGWFDVDIDVDIVAIDDVDAKCSMAAGLQPFRSGVLQPIWFGLREIEQTTQCFNWPLLSLLRWTDGHFSP